MNLIRTLPVQFLTILHDVLVDLVDVSVPRVPVQEILGTFGGARRPSARDGTQERTRQGHGDATRRRPIDGAAERTERTRGRTRTGGGGTSRACTYTNTTTRIKPTPTASFLLGSTTKTKN